MRLGSGDPSSITRGGIGNTVRHPAAWRNAVDCNGWRTT